MNGTYGVERLLTRGGQPEPVLRGLVEQLVAVTQQDGSVCFSPSLREGQTVRVTAGPFATLVGKLEHRPRQVGTRALGILGFGWVSTRSILMFTALAGLGGAIELLQPLFGREANFLDWLAGVTGVAAAFIIVTIVRRLTVDRVGSSDEFLPALDTRA